MRSEAQVTDSRCASESSESGHALSHGCMTHRVPNLHLSLTSAMTSTLHTLLGDELYHAWRERASIPPFSARKDGFSLADAYAVQQRFVARRIGAGETVVGKKIGVTSQAVQDMLD